MSASRLYKVCSVLLVLFAIGHTIGFSHVDPSWGADSIASGMRTVTFDVQGFSRSYWDFFFGFGLFVTVFLLFGAVLAWRFGLMPAERLSAMAIERWSFALCFVVIAGLTWSYFFLAPGVLSTLAAVGLVWAAAKA